MAPAKLAQVLRPIQELYQPADYPDLLVGLDHPDDAAVYQLDADRALVISTDFFTPIVDDPFQYGAIAAANSLSDVYAMGATPLLALNILALPNNLPEAMASEIIRGLVSKAIEAKTVIAGGHSIQDDEPKVGLVVVGLVAPDKLMKKGGAHPGDVLVLSKPLGSGVIATAAKQGKAEAAHLQNAVEWMARLNRDASYNASKVGAGSATDITGFGLLGHASEMANSAALSFRIQYEAVPLLDGALDYAAQWLFPGGSSNNTLDFGDGVHFAEHIEEMAQMLLFDAQTSGGILAAIPAAQLPRYAELMAASNSPFWQIGSVEARQGDTAIFVE